MGNIMSVFGFNQPFLLTLLGIIIILTVTVVFVTDAKADNDGPVYQDIEWERPKITIHSPFPTTAQRVKDA